MRFLPTAAAVLAAAGFSATLAADLDEARRLIQADKPDAALEITTAALGEDPHDPHAHALHLSALHARGRAREAIPELDAWAAEEPDDPRPLLILFTAYTLLNDHEGLLSVRDRGCALPEETRRVFLRAIVLHFLRQPSWEDAARTLDATPAPVTAAPIDRQFRVLAAAARGAELEVYEQLEADPGMADWEQGELGWWIDRLLGVERTQKPAESADAVAGGVVSRPRVDVPVLPNDDITVPTVLHKVDPIYPDAARQARVQGKVVIMAAILRSGRVGSTTILVSSNPMLNEAAQRAILRWRYDPARHNGEPMRLYFTIRVDFSLSPDAE